MDGNSDECARMMRHNSTRILVSTQSPHVLAPELLELVTVAVVQHFHSPDWFSYLSKKIPLEPAHFDEILNLVPGEAIVFSPRHAVKFGWYQV